MSGFTNTFRASLSQTVRVRAIFAAFAFLIGLLAAHGAQAQATVTVTRIDDRSNATCAAGDCSLREAVNAANAAATNDTINFAIPAGSCPAGVCTITLVNSEIQINNSGSLTVSGTGANRLTIDGGAGTNRIFYSNGATFNLSGVTLTSGGGTGATASGDGGAIYANGGTTIISGVYFNANTGASRGGGIYFTGGTNHRVENSTFSGNTASNFGGGVYVENTNLAVVNTTLSGNSASSLGGGIFASGSGTLTLRGDTITNNTAGFGGGVTRNDSTLDFGNTIIAGNTATGFSTPEISANSSGRFISQGYNLVGDSAGDSTNPDVPITYQSTDIRDTPPLLDPLANYGGTTPTHRLQTGSPAIDKGSSFGLTTDQRGFARPVDNPSITNAAGGDGADIGAYEVQAAPPSQDDVTSPADPVQIVNGMDDGDGVNGPPSAGENVDKAIDNTTTKYLNFLDLGSGLIVTPNAGSTIVDRLRVYTANDAPERDPATYLLEGSNNGGVTFTQISSGALNLPDGRNAPGQPLTTPGLSFNTVAFSNTTAYTSYRLTFPTLKNSGMANSVQIGEIELLGVAAPPAPPLTVTRTDDRDMTCNSGDCSLREAVKAANAAVTNDTINFAIPAGSCPAGVCTITLTNDIQINNSGSLTVSGTGANRLTIDGGAGTNRIFSSNGATFNLSGVTLTSGGGTGAFISGNGGAVYANGGTTTISGVYFNANSASNNGGGIYFTGGTNHRVENSTFSGNTSSSNSNGGGGIFVQNTNLAVVNTTLSGNSASGPGGGISTAGSGTLTLRGDTITNNFASQGGSVTLGGGGTLDFGNTIIAGNTGGSTPEILINTSAFGTTTATSRGYNLVGDSAGDSTNTGTAITYQSTDIQNTPPLLDPLANYGGTTPTHRLQTGSPAIDKGSSFGLTTDQRGFTRPVDNPGITNATGGNGADIGAFEVQLAPTAATVTISGRAQTSTGRGIRNVLIQMTDGSGQTRYAYTTAFGYYRFTDVNAGETYIITARGKRYEFAQPTQVLNVNEDAIDVNFVAYPN